MIADTDTTNWIEEFPLMMNQEDSWLSDFKCVFGESSSELFSSTTKEARTPLMEEGQDPLLLNQMQHPEGVGTEPFKSNSTLLGIPELPDMPFCTSESGLLPELPLAVAMEHKPSSSMKNLKGILNENKSMNKKIKEEAHQDFNGEKSFDVASAVCPNPACQAPGTMKKCVVAPLIKKGEELSNLQATQKMHDGRMKALVEEEIDPISNFHAPNEFGVKKSLTLLSPTRSVATIKLESLQMAQLRAMAKERKLKRYSKLNKSDVIKLLEKSL